MDMPSYVEVPRPSSSRMTSDRGVAWIDTPIRSRFQDRERKKLTLVRILLQSSISTLNVEALAKIKSLAPIRE